MKRLSVLRLPSRLKSKSSNIHTISSFQASATESTISTSSSPAATTTEDVIIAFMGVTGAGKSSFIQALTGRSDIIVGDGLKSTTGDVQSYHITINSINFVLVDTPGFNDTYRDDVDIIKAIIAWLNSSYRQGTKLTGILYLHPIKDPRMEGSSLRNFRAFQQLCGENTFKNIVLCTTFWDQVSESDGARREKELCENPEFWGRMKSRGSRVTQIRNYAQSKDILLQMARRSTVTLDIQKEMVEERRSLDNTGVGRAMEEMARLKSEHEAQLEKLKIDGEKRLKIQEEENRRRIAELAAVREEQQRMLKEQEAEQARQARVKAQLQEDKRQEEIRAAAERRRFEEVQNENRRLAAERERLLNQWATREADEKKAIAESHRRRMCRSFREEFAGQTQALDRARNYRMVFAKLLGFHQQTPAFLRWCDHCFQLIGFKAFYHCEPCSQYICTACWTHGQRCQTSYHSPSYKKDTTPSSCCRRLKVKNDHITCDRCKQPCRGLHFHCCDCLNDDFDICLNCVTSRGTCWNPGHWLHPTMIWPT